MCHVWKPPQPQARSGPGGVHESLFVRYDAIISVHMQVQLHIMVPINLDRGSEGGRASVLYTEGSTMDVAYSGVQASRLQEAAWRKSRYSNPTGNCVEAAQLQAGAVAVRNSRYPDGPALVFTRAEWEAFLLGARDGDFDGA
jgi:hypothetical protein